MCGPRVACPHQRLYPLPPVATVCAASVAVPPMHAAEPNGASAVRGVNSPAASLRARVRWRFLRDAFMLNKIVPSPVVAFVLSLTEVRISLPPLIGVVRIRPRWRG